MILDVRVRVKLSSLSFQVLHGFKNQEPDHKHQLLHMNPQSVLVIIRVRWNVKPPPSAVRWRWRWQLFDGRHEQLPDSKFNTGKRTVRRWFPRASLIISVHPLSFLLFLYNFLSFFTTSLWNDLSQAFCRLARLSNVEENQRDPRDALVSKAMKKYRVSEKYGHTCSDDSIESSYGRITRRCLLRITRWIYINKRIYILGLIWPLDNFIIDGVYRRLDDV